MAPLQRSSAGWMPARIGRLSAGVGRRHPVTIRKASLMAGLMWRVWALQHKTGAQCSAVEWTRARVSVRNVISPASQPEPASLSRVRRVMSTFCEVTRVVGDTRATYALWITGKLGSAFHYYLGLKWLDPRCETFHRFAHWMKVLSTPCSRAQH